MRRTGRTGLTGLVVALTLLLAGCVGVPTSGRVERVQGQEQACQNCVNVEVSPPSPGDDPRQVVEGFLRANAYYQSGYSVAKQYLTREAAQDWKPETGATVYDLDAVSVKDDQVSLSGRTLGTLAADRSYQARGGDFAQTFTVSRQDGEWRIATPPAGLLVADYAFDRSYATYDLYFLANGRPSDQPGAVQSPVLVPDPIWLPQFRNPGRVASALVKALLTGPTSWLAPAVTTAIPPGTTLSVDSVTITDGVASVALSDAVLSLPDAQRSLLAAQIVYTLKDALAVRGVLITVNQQGFRVPESDPTTLVVPTTAISSQLDPVSPNAGNQLYVVQAGKVALADGSTGELRPFSGDLGSTSISSLAVSVTDTDLAAVTDGRTRLVEATTAGAGTKARTVLSGVTDLSRPQFTRFGELWALGRQGGRQQLWRIADGAKPVLAPDLDGRDITAFSFSPDGVRVAFIERVRGGQRLLVGHVDRGDGVEVKGVRELDTRQSDSPQLTQLKDLAWLDATHVMVLGAATAKDTAGPYAVSEDASSVVGQGEALAWNPVEVAVLLRTQSAIVRSQNGQTWRDQGTTWVPFVKDVDAVAYPG
ncbi:Sporulation and spore germination [Microlunatus sagamiharensis]|uniref:Sporulation and spore germination n=1 Tax=Microlunatus sagamiharensis TaxID=546874 RepID=A0A1H2MEB0_9ACTN|nr:GerMN domain-containing protein [Microlunatus sagamiharensis]SDU91472.1 Sporulation and spore germination [Microlunatus sagamiharensis]